MIDCGESVATRLMMPIMEFLSCTDLIDDFESLSHHQKHHAKIYVTSSFVFG